MQVISADIPDVLIIESKIFGDPRGYFLEMWNSERYQKAGLTGTFVQDNLSFSSRCVLRGLHFQNPKAQAKLVTVLQGETYDVAVDIRVGSPTFGPGLGSPAFRE